MAIELTDDPWSGTRFFVLSTGFGPSGINSTGSGCSPAPHYRCQEKCPIKAFINLRFALDLIKTRSQAPWRPSVVPALPRISRTSSCKTIRCAWACAALIQARHKEEPKSLASSSSCPAGPPDHGFVTINLEQLLHSRTEMDPDESCLGVRTVAGLPSQMLPRQGLRCPCTAARAKEVVSMRGKICQAHC